MKENRSKIKKRKDELKRNEKLMKKVEGIKNEIMIIKNDPDIIYGFETDKGFIGIMYCNGRWDNYLVIDENEKKVYLSGIYFDCEINPEEFEILKKKGIIDELKKRLKRR